MWIVDTNVLSELMRVTPEPTVVAWLDGQAPESIWTTSITVFELKFGVALLADGRRKKALRDALDALLHDDLAGRVLDFDSAAAAEAAALAARRQQAGRGVDMRDTQIAAIALARKAGIVTRNLRHFDDLAIEVVDPWSALPS
jgi:predicted nucleic acid-binding protein